MTTFIHWRDGSLRARDTTIPKRMPPKKSRKYSEDEPRDDHGRWTSGGSNDNVSTDASDPRAPLTKAELRIDKAIEDAGGKAEIALDGMDPKLAHEVAGRIEKFGKEFPFALKQVKGVNTHGIDNTFIGDSMRSAYASTTTFQGSNIRLWFNTERYADAAKLQSHLDGLSRTEADYHPLYTTQSIVDHELGHVLDLSAPGGMEYSSSPDSAAFTSLGGYANTEPHEAFAEAFAMHQAGAKMDVHAAEVMDRVVNAAHAASQLLNKSMDNGPFTFGPTCRNYIKPDTAPKSAVLRTLIDIERAKYSPDQPRDWHGRFGEGGGDPRAEARQRIREQAMVEPPTDEERVAIGRYIGPRGPELNNALRIQARLTPEQEALRHSLDTAISRATVAEQMPGRSTLYRGMTTTHEFKIGDTFMDRGFVSTTTNPSFAEGFATGILADKERGDPWIMHIDVDSEHQHAVPGYPGLDEVILPRDMEFTVTDVQEPLDPKDAMYVTVKAKSK